MYLEIIRIGLYICTISTNDYDVDEGKVVKILYKTDGAYLNVGDSEEMYEDSAINFPKDVLKFLFTGNF